METKEKSLSLNSIYYLIYNALNVVFPFVTGIYVSHILLSSDIGLIESARNVASYFVLLSFLGIPTYGLREVARARKNKEDLNRLYSELRIINNISTFIFLIIYLCLICLVPKYNADIVVYLLAGISIALNFLNNSWLFEGLEKFGFISIRNLIFKSLSFIFLFICVRTKNDFLWYLIITIIGTAGNYIFNIISSPKYVKITFKNLNLKKHIKPIFFLTAVNLAIEIYSMVDITMLSFMCDKEIVAYYSYGMKIHRILIQLINTFTMVLVPRIALYFKEERREELNNVVSKTFLVIMVIAIPMIIGIWFTSDYLVPSIYGEEYISSSEVLKILSFILAISPVGYLLGSRMLLISGNENKMIIAVGSGALANLLFNLLLIPFFKEIGAAAASLIGEVFVMMIYLFLGRRYYKLVCISDSIWKIVISMVLMGVFLLMMHLATMAPLAKTIIQISGSVFLYFGTLLLLRENITLSFAKKCIKVVTKNA